jgi:hypothetical protein
MSELIGRNTLPTITSSCVAQKAMESITHNSLSELAFCKPGLREKPIFVWLLELVDPGFTVTDVARAGSGFDG